jgi:hypothetical protein
MTSAEGALPREIAEIVGGEMAPGERITWVGQPIPSRIARKSLPLVLFGIPWTAFAIFWVAVAGIGVWGSGNKTDPDAASQIFKFFPLFGVPFVLLGFAMLSSPFWMRRSAARTAYVITDRRLVVIEGRRRGLAIRSFLPDRLNDIRRVQRPDGSGDIIIAAQGWTAQGGGGIRREEQGFFGIPDVKAVEEMVRALGAKARSPDVS